MSLAIWFWIIFVISLLFGLYTEYVPTVGWYRIGRHIIIYILLFILGMQVFGGPVR